MNKIFFVFALLLCASYAVNDWKECTDAIVKIQYDIVDLEKFLADAVKSTFIPDVEKIIADCKKTNDWATCATSIFAMGEDIVTFGHKIEVTVKDVLIPDVVAIEKKCKKQTLEEQVNDWPTCLEDISKIVEIAARIAEDIKKFNFVKLVKDIQELYNIVQKAISDCTKQNLQMSIPSDWPTCLEDISKIVEIAAKIAQDIKKFNFVELVKDIQELYNIVQKAISDCTKQQLETDNDWPTCLEDISKVVEIAGRIAEDIKKFNFVALVKDIQELYNIVQKAIQDCTKQQMLTLEPNDWPTCLEDISKIVELAGRIADDIKKFNFVALVKDIQELYNTVQKAISDCTKTRFDEPDGDWPTCLEDISKIVEIAARIAGDIKKFNFIQLVKDIQELYNIVQKALQDCTKQSELLLEPNDWQKCLEDINQIAQLAKKIQDDVKHFNLPALVKDIAQLYATVQQALKDCTK